jgi:S-DNA-T family DNA segregation ATPase FtsK/SpoIIIE
MSTKTDRKKTRTERRRHAEAKAALWMARHPGLTTAPAALTASVTQFGPTTTGGVLAGTVAAGIGWWRADPDSFRRYGAPRLRSFGHRWGRYVGPRWRHTLTQCDLVKDDRRTGRTLVPRVLKVQSPTPSIDVITVKIVKGQSLRTFQDAQEELAAALGADVLGIEKTKPRVLTLTAVHGNPFDSVVPAVDIPDDVSDVDLGSIEVGDTEYGTPWTEPLIGQHWLVCGATGSGKSSLLWNPLRAMGPLIRERLVRVTMIDPKGGMETEQGRELFYDYATSADPDVVDDEGDEFDAMLTTLCAFRDRMTERQALLRDRKQRKFTMAPDTPFEVLMIDELAMLTAFGNSARELNKILAEILTQGRACGFAVVAYVQEPTKDIVPVRDLFTRRICLRVGSDYYVDIVLGDGARAKGALADQIPETEDYAGIGYRTTERSRTPIRVQAGHTTDDDITELVRTCAPRHPATSGGGLALVA